MNRLYSAVLALALAPAGAGLAQQGGGDDSDMVTIPGGTFQMGFEHGYDDEAPVHEVTIDSFLLDRHEVTNRQFAAFVEATGHVTQAERDGYAWCYLKGDSDFTQVWGAKWNSPEGPESSIDDRMDHPGGVRQLA